MSRLPIRIVKVGGSLLDLPDLGHRVHLWLAAQSRAHHVLVAGGGKLVDVVRKYHSQQPLSEAAAHWMCVDLMTVTAHMLQDRLGQIPLIEDDRVLCQRLGWQGCTIFGPGSWLRQAEPHLPGTKLPHTWQVTSDSITARLAIVTHAAELVLLKSSLPKKEKTLAELAEQGVVDAFLPCLEAEMPAVRVVNLRE